MLRVALVGLIPTIVAGAVHAATILLAAGLGRASAATVVVGIISLPHVPSSRKGLDKLWSAQLARETTWARIATRSAII